MNHYNPYSGKRKGERYVKLTKAERDSIERVLNIASDIAGSRHTNPALDVRCANIESDVGYLLGEINEANEISLLSKEANEENVKAREVNKELAKAAVK